MLIINAAASIPKYAALLQSIIFLPSNPPNGMRLNNASHALIIMPIWAMVGITNINGMKSIAKTRLAAGPELAIIPPSLFETKPEMTTAPGAAITNPKKLMTIASISILLFALNSACLPNFFAKYL